MSTSPSIRLRSRNRSSVFTAIAATAGCLIAVWSAGCNSVSRRTPDTPTFDSTVTPFQQSLQTVETPAESSPAETFGGELLSAEPLTISNFQDAQPWDLTIDQCVEMALANSEVLEKLGGVVVNNPFAVDTLYDQALQETGIASVENALSAFDTQFSTSFFYNRSERQFNNLFIGGGAPSLISNVGAFQAELTKTSATGAQFSVRNITDYNRNNSPANLFGSTFDTVNQLEYRQPLLRGAGTVVNRIAGPNALPGQYNGVLIRRINSDISLADFQAAVRNLVRDVETNYWELHFAYRNLDTQIAARESARKTWENRKLRLDNEVGRPDDEAQARQQYYNFDIQAKNALAGTAIGQLGVLGAERNLRRLLGVSASDGRLIRPATEPTIAPITFDWNQAQHQTLNNRIELIRQKWVVNQRELELLAAKQLNQWRFDVVGQYGFRGFGDNLFGSSDRPNGSAFDELVEGNLDEWQLGFEYGGAIGRRAGHLAVRNAEVNLVREKAVLKEQQRQLLHDLNAAYTEVDRAMQAMRSTYNARVAAFDDLDPKRKRVEAGQDQVFFLLDAQSRTATAESNAHRAVADYNQALLNFEFASGNLLAKYNVRLTEGPWTQVDYQRSAEKSTYFENQIKRNTFRDLPAVSLGER